jgi:phosphoglycerol transferase MdoB-like AlkP superfamily enzyme
MYYKGVEPWEIDVKGRNSLDLAPTILDYVGIDCENYFLGSTLFMNKNNNNNYDTVFSDGGTYSTSDGDAIAGLSEAQAQITLNLINRYYIANQQVPLAPETP